MIDGGGINNNIEELKNEFELSEKRRIEITEYNIENENVDNYYKTNE